MKDFRYHLTSLAAVFLALAIGVILGAGPLQYSISGALGGKVESLQEENERLNREQQNLSEKYQAAEEFIGQWAGETQAKALHGRNIAVVTLQTVPKGEVEKLKTALQNAGAEISGVVTVTEKFWNESTQTYRSSLAAQVRQYLKDTSEAESPDTLLARELAVGLGTDAAAEQAREILANPANSLVAFDQMKAAADSAVLLTNSASTDNPAAEDEITGSWLYDLANGLNTLAQPAIALGDAGTENTPLARLRSQSAPLTTVDSFPQAQSLVVTVQALEINLSSSVAFGSQIGATQMYVPAGNGTVEGR